MVATWEGPAQAADGAEVVFTSLPGPRQIDEVTLAANGMYAGASEGMVHVDLSSNSLSAVKRLAGLAAQQGIGFLDAPVSGGPAGAEAGTLSVMVGGEPATLDGADFTGADIRKVDFRGTRNLDKVEGLDRTIGRDRARFD